jgi:hypothetical protein
MYLRGMDAVQLQRSEIRGFYIRVRLTAGWSPNLAHALINRLLMAERSRAPLSSCQISPRPPLVVLLPALLYNASHVTRTRVSPNFLFFFHAVSGGCLL